MPILSDQIRIGALDYRIVLVDDLRDEDGCRLLGQAAPGELEIRLDSSQPEQLRWLTLLHEILHLLLEHAGRRDADEGLIAALAHGLLGLWPPEVLFG